MDKASTLLTVGRALQAKGFVANLQQKHGGGELQGLSLSLEGDDKGRKIPLFLQLWLPGEGHQSDDTHLFQLVAALPFRYQPSYMTETVRFILLVNSLIDLPGFNIEPTQRLVTYRYALLASGKEASPELVCQVATRVRDILKLYGPSIEEIATGKRTFEQAYRRTQTG